MKVTLGSLDLFWLGEQAKALHAQGFLDQLFTTRTRPHVEGIPGHLGTSCYPLHYALRVMQRWPHWVGGNTYYLQLCRLFDAWLSSKLPRPVDILAVLSGVGVQSFRKVRRAGIVTVVECGSTHTDFQHEVVSAEFRRCGLKAPLFPEAYRDRVRTEFAEADFIQIPSTFVGKTFIEHGVPAEKLVYATYGVDVARFTPRPAPTGSEPFRIVCPSGVNLRKGARILIEAWRRLGWQDAELHWIGSAGRESAHLFRDVPATVHFHAWMSHDELSALYRRCDAFVLPSFEEGFARVMLEAAASGLPLIVTPNTGAEDFLDPAAPEGWVIEAGTIEALCEALKAARQDRQATFEKGQRAHRKAQACTWEAYGQRVIANYAGMLRTKGP